MANSLPLDQRAGKDDEPVVSGIGARLEEPDAEQLIRPLLEAADGGTEVAFPPGAVALPAASEPLKWKAVSFAGLEGAGGRILDRHRQYGQAIAFTAPGLIGRH